MADNKVLIDTEDLRRIARFTKGGLAELSAIKLDVVKAGVVLSADPTTSTAYYGVLASLDSIGTAVKGDHDALVNEVVAIETEEGLDPLSAPKPPAPVEAPAASTGGGLGNFLLLKWKILPILLSETSATVPPPPAPWNTGWVSADGSTGTVSTEVSFGVEWKAHEQGDGYDVYAGAHAEGNAGASASGYSNSDGIGGQVEAHAHLGAGASAGGSFGNAAAGGSGSASVEAALDAQAHAKGSIGKDGIDAEVGASASASAKAAAEAELHAGPASVGGNAHAETSAEAHAGAQGHAGTDGVSGSYEAGAMAKASAGAGVEGSVAGVEGNYGVEVGVGVGVEAGGGFSFTSTDIGFDFNASLGLGLELGIDFGIHINLEEIGEGIGDLFTDPVDTLDRWISPDDAPAAPDAPAPTPEPDPHVGPNGEYIGQFATTPPPTPPAGSVDGAGVGMEDLGRVAQLDQVGVAPIDHVGQVGHVGHVGQVGHVPDPGQVAAQVQAVDAGQGIDMAFEHRDVGQLIDAPQVSELGGAQVADHGASGELVGSGADLGVHLGAGGSPADVSHGAGAVGHAAVVHDGLGPIGHHAVGVDAGAHHAVVGHDAVIDPSGQNVGDADVWLEPDPAVPPPPDAIR